MQSADYLDALDGSPNHPRGHTTSRSACSVAVILAMDAEQISSSARAARPLWRARPDSSHEALVIRFRSGSAAGRSNPAPEPPGTLEPRRPSRYQSQWTRQRPSSSMIATTIMVARSREEDQSTIADDLGIELGRHCGFLVDRWSQQGGRTKVPAGGGPPTGTSSCEGLNRRQFSRR